MEGTDPIFNAKFETVVEVNQLLKAYGIKKFWFEMGRKKVQISERPSLFKRIRYKYWVLQQYYGNKFRKAQNEKQN